MSKPTITTLGALIASGYVPRSIKQELRENLIACLQGGQNAFEGILGFEDTVLPDVERAILSRHNILLLGLRGQAKTRIARLMVNLLDEWTPVVAGSELNDDPMQPISRFGCDLVAELGDATPVSWLHRADRYVEKLATPDVSVADLIGDVDPILAANLKLPYSDERVIHFGLVPRAHRCIFVINELPDLQARIQVSLFNILQEGDIQIRGFKLRLPLDVSFVFTANPEDYTNRGSIITPLKDRIQSQILTHYPEDLLISRRITEQEAKPAKAQSERIGVPDEMRTLLEMIAFEARGSEFIDPKSGVSARLSISAFENLMSAAERRMLLNAEDTTTTRLIDLWGVIPAITGKVELVYEGEIEGPQSVAYKLIGGAIKKMLLSHFPNPDASPKKKQERDPYDVLRAYFGDDNRVTLLTNAKDIDYTKSLNKVPSLRKLAEKQAHTEQDVQFMMELLLFGLAECNVVQRENSNGQMVFGDSILGMFDSNFDDE